MTTTTLGTPDTSYIRNENLRHEVQRLLAERETYGDFLAYPVLQETGTFTGMDANYKLISGMQYLVASVYLYLLDNSVRNSLFTAIVLGVDGKVKLEGGASVFLVDTAIAYQWVDAATLFYPALAPAEMMRNLEAAQAPAKNKPSESITTKVVAKQVGKKPASPAKATAKLPNADELRKIAKAQGVDTTSVNFRSSTQRAALAIKLGIH